MDVKLESLIEKIKKDGIDEAKKLAEEIISKAENQAAALKKQAQIQAEEIAEKARIQAQKIKDNTESSLRQAARDLTIVLKNEIISLFDKILKEKISKELSPDFIKQLIVKMIDKWSPTEESILEVFVSKEDEKKLKELLLLSLKEKAKKTIEIKVSKTLDKGFCIGLKGENAYYDFTDESILDALKEFLNPAISAMLDAKNG